MSDKYHTTITLHKVVANDNDLSDTEMYRIVQGSADIMAATLGFDHAEAGVFKLTGDDGLEPDHTGVGFDIKREEEDEPCGCGGSWDGRDHVCDAAYERNGNGTDVG